ncbi:hypothetical protein LY78DRAFT_422489 [Colletotrichum sublineola]|nr:hypothetical protein LY78DRAFT_422489 [Colletotrichum sublineola]
MLQLPFCLSFPLHLETLSRLHPGLKLMSEYLEVVDASADVRCLPLCESDSACIGELALALNARQDLVDFKGKEPLQIANQLRLKGAFAASTSRDCPHRRCGNALYSSSNRAQKDHATRNAAEYSAKLELVRQKPKDSHDGDEIRTRAVSHCGFEVS